MRQCGLVESAREGVDLDCYNRASDERGVGVKATIAMGLVMVMGCGAGWVWADAWGCSAWGECGSEGGGADGADGGDRYVDGADYVQAV